MTVELRLPEVLDGATPGAYDPDDLDALRAELLRTSERLERACDYGRQLWSCLDATRHYLLDEVAGGEDAGPSMLSGTAEWQAWATQYAVVSSTLAGLAGDRGFGSSEARLVARSHGADIRPD